MDELSVMAIGLLLAGIGLMIVSVLLRLGVPRFLRRWMNPGVEDWMLERLVLLGLPVAALFLVLASGTGAADRPTGRLRRLRDGPGRPGAGRGVHAHPAPADPRLRLPTMGP